MMGTILIFLEIFVIIKIIIFIGKLLMKNGIIEYILDFLTYDLKENTREFIIIIWLSILITAIILQTKG